MPGYLAMALARCAQCKPSVSTATQAALRWI